MRTDPPAFDPKTPRETVRRAIDFAAALQAGETIASRAVEAGGGDIVVSGDSLDGTVVAFTLSGGSPGLQRLSVRVTLNTGETIEATPTIVVLA